MPRKPPTVSIPIAQRGSSVKNKETGLARGNSLRGQPKRHGKTRKRLRCEAQRSAIDRLFQAHHRRWGHWDLPSPPLHSVASLFTVLNSPRPAPPWSSCLPFTEVLLRSICQACTGLGHNDRAPANETIQPEQEPSEHRSNPNL